MTVLMKKLVMLLLLCVTVMLSSCAQYIDTRDTYFYDTRYDQPLNYFQVPINWGANCLITAFNATEVAVVSIPILPVGIVTLDGALVGDQYIMCRAYTRLCSAGFISYRPWTFQEVIDSRVCYDDPVLRDRFELVFNQTQTAQMCFNWTCNLLVVTPLDVPLSVFSIATTPPEAIIIPYRHWYVSQYQEFYTR